LLNIFGGHNRVFLSIAPGEQCYFTLHFA
jgi:hypothetical protein